MTLIRSVCLFVLLLHTPALAEEVSFSGAWIRATKGTMPHSAGYVTIENNGASDARLVAARIIAPEGLRGMVSIHETIEKDGVFRMQALEHGLDIPAGATSILRPKSTHLMLMQLNQKLSPRMAVTLELEFANNQRIPVVFSVQ